VALTRTLAQIRASVRQTADIEGVAALNRHPDANLNDYINRGIAWVYYRINESRGGQYYLSSTTITTSTGVAVYALDATFYRLLSVVAIVNGASIPLLRIDDEATRVALSDTSRGWSGIPLRYELTGGNFTFYPTPGAAYSLAIRFVPSAPQLVNDSDTLDTIERFDDAVIYFAAREVAMKDEQYELIAILDGRLAEMDERIRASSPKRDEAVPPRIQDSRVMTRGWTRGMARLRRWY
jgi:hypothetical protein